MLIILEITIIGITIWFWENVGYIWLICMHSVYIPLFIPILMDPEIKIGIMVNLRKIVIITLMSFVCWLTIIFTVSSWPDWLYKSISENNTKEMEKLFRPKSASTIKFLLWIMNARQFYWFIILFSISIYIYTLKSTLKWNWISTQTDERGEIHE